MAVFRVERNTGYTVMSNHHLRNKELTLKAKGLLSQMLSLPEDWDYSVNDSKNVKTMEKCIRSENFNSLANKHLEELFDEKDYEGILYFLDHLDESGYGENHLSDSLDQLILSAVKASIAEENPEDGFSIVKDFSDLNYHSDNLKTLLAEEISAIRAEVWSSTDTSKIVDYVELVKSCLDGNYYTSIIECFPYQEMKAYIESNGKTVIGQNGLGGYYDTHQEEYQNLDYWYDPLSKKKVGRGSVGTYHYTETYEFHGDFMATYYSKYWYDTSFSDPNNSSDSELSYKGEYMGNDNFIDIPLFLSIIDPEYANISAAGREVYYIGTEDDVMFVGISGSNIYIVHNKKMVTIAYE